MFVEDLAPLFADFGVLAVFGARTAMVLLDMPGEEIFGGMQQSTEYAITYRSTDLPGLAAGDAGTVDGVAYKVRQTTPHDDGRIIKAMLKK
jgi:hypothetical protein